MTPPASLSVDWNKIVVVPKVDSGFIRWSKTHHIPPEWFVRQVRDFDLWIVSGGRGKLRHPNGETIDLKRGVVIYLRPNDVGEAWQEPGKEPLTMFWFHHDLLLKGRKLKAQALSNGPIWYETIDIGFYEIVSRKIHRLVRPPFPLTPVEMEAQYQQASTLLRGLLIEFDYNARLLEYPRHRGIETSHMNLVNELSARIQEKPEIYSDASILAKYTGYSKDHLTRIFKKVVDKTPTEVIIEARIQKAKNLLAATDLTVNEIAEGCGYQNAFYFSNQFKKKEGLSPTEFRKQH